jgi:hypothetical protein
MSIFQDEQWPWWILGGFPIFLLIGSCGVAQHTYEESTHFIGWTAFIIEAAYLIAFFFLYDAFHDCASTAEKADQFQSTLSLFPRAIALKIKLPEEL